MKCERCLSTDGKSAEFRVRSDVIDLKVCPMCAIEARVLGSAVEPFTEGPGYRTTIRKKHDGLQIFVG